MTSASDAARELLLPALLAMDVYHRDAIGGLLNATPNASGTKVDDLGKSIDTATPMSGELGNSGEFSTIGFFAKSYTVGDKIYIVYRGTDDGALDVANNPGAIGSTLLGNTTLPDLYYGYPMAAGSLSSLGSTYGSIGSLGWSNGDYNSQAIKAVRYYKQVRDANPDKEIVVVGQSLGGGLAGFVGSLYGLKTYVFNAAPYELATLNAYWSAHYNLAGPDGGTMREFLYGSPVWDNTRQAPIFSDIITSAYVPGEVEIRGQCIINLSSAF
jgi:fermentation-respiration switch protein FrsA (DUF1100 family)